MGCDGDVTDKDGKRDIEKGRRSHQAEQSTGGDAQERRLSRSVRRHNVMRFVVETLLNLVIWIIVFPVAWVLSMPVFLISPAFGKDPYRTAPVGVNTSS
jgi:hypothetical protein